MKKVKYILAVLIATVLTSCGSTPQSGTDEHAHEEKLQLTSYSDSFEVFAEATPFVIGQASDILSHFSFLSDFKPLEEGSVTVSLIVGTNGVRQTLDKPTRKGIYSFTLTPDKAGTGKVVFDIKSAKGTSQIIVPNVTVYSDVHDAQHDAADAVASSSNGAVFTKEQSWKVDFATEESRNESFGQLIKTTAQVMPSQGDERVVTAKASGIVIFTGDNVVDGKAVSAGQNLFRIESSDMADNNMNVRYNEALTEYNRAKTEFDRKSKLAEDKIVSASDLLKAKTEYDNAQTVYNNLRKNFSTDGQNVSASIGGFVKQLLVRSGEFVEAGQPLVSISQNRNLFIKAELKPKYYPLLGNITSANIREQNSGKVYTLSELGGKVVSYGKSADVANPLIPVVFQVNNTVGLLPGSFVQMYIKTQTAANAITVANEALVEEMGNYFVYRQLTPEFFEKTEVKIGSTDGKRTEILHGLTGGERVVTKGAILVKLAQASGALDAHSGHVH